MGHTDPSKALADFMAHPHEFHAVITDVGMPGISGFECVRAMLSVRPDLPVLMTSGCATNDELESARRAGARAMLAKPHSVQELCSAVSALFLPAKV